jgi:hypothetical protein
MSNITGYDSPIEIILGDLEVKQEDAIIKVVRDIGIKVNKDELIKALNFDRNQYEKGKVDGVKEFIKRLEKNFEEFQEYGITWDELEEVAEEMGV